MPCRFHGCIVILSFNIQTHCFPLAGWHLYHECFIYELLKVAVTKSNHNFRSGTETYPADGIFLFEYIWSIAYVDFKLVVHY